jgi:nucleotide sugar dehydrogenase
MIKYTANAVQATLISFANEIAGMCETIPGLDEATVMRGVHLDRCWGAPGRDGEHRLAGAVTYLRAGIGFGGSCFPKDLKALREFARDKGIELPILQSVLKVSKERASRVVDLLADHFGVQGKRIGVLGLVFKPDTDDVRESPGVSLAKVLLARGADVVMHDPVVRLDAVKHHLGTGITQASDVAGAATGADAIVIATGWACYRGLDWTDIAPRTRSPIIFDGRQVVSSDQIGDGMTLLATGRRAASAVDAMLEERKAHSRAASFMQGVVVRDLHRDQA